VIAYLLRRMLYVIPILVGVNLLTFALFFVVNTPDDMARMQKLLDALESLDDVQDVYTTAAFAG